MTVRLSLFHPEVATRSCDDCKKWQYRPDGTLMIRGRPQDGGKPILRTTPTPCFECPKVPADATERSSEYAQEPSARSWKIYRHYRECRAVRQFPEDDLVRRHAGIIRRIEAAWERQPLLTLGYILGAKLSGG